MQPAQLILASASPRRQSLLAGLGFRCEVRPSDLPEDHQPGESPEEFARRMAQLKARHAAPQSVPILGADTIVVINGQILGKPRDRADALAMLNLLSGRTHRVITAFCLVFPNQHEHLETVNTAVTFKHLSGAEIETYLDRGGWEDKAGAYAIQSTAAAMVRCIDGSYTNVVGLPLCEVVEALDRYTGQATEAA